MRNILLTGASGMVGATLLPKLAAHDVTALVHRTQAPVRTVRGDLTRPLLGMDRTDYRELTGRIDTVIHCAAIVDFSTESHRLHATNLHGTQHVVEFCRRAEAELIYVSTAFVARAPFARRAPDSNAESPLPYIESKLEAEAVVRGSGVPASIVRLSVVCGDSITGEIGAYQAFHQFLADWASGDIVLLPSAPETTFDIVPKDIVAEVLAALAARPIIDADYWVTSGDAALTQGRLVELAIARSREMGMPLPEYTLVPAVQAQQRLREMPGAVNPLFRYRFDSLVNCGYAFDDAPPVRTSLGAIPGGPEPITPEAAERIFLAAISHVLHRRAGARSPAASRA